MRKATRLVAALACGAAWFSGALAAEGPAVERGVNEAGQLYAGSADAPVTLEEWSDYLCPFCARHFRNTLPELIENYVGSGKLRIVFRDFPIAGLHPTAPAGHAAAACVATLRPELAWPMHDALFERQSEWSRLPDPAPFLAGVAGGLGVDPAAYADCMTKGDAAKRVSESVAEGRALGYSSTPSFRALAAGRAEPHEFSGAYPYEHFAAIIDALLAGEDPPGEPEPPKPQLPDWAKPEGLAPDPARPGFTVAGDAWKGNPEAAVTVVEFSDFQCPACAKHAMEVQPAINEKLIDTGKLRWVHKHLPLPMHRWAALAAVAAECAGEQGRYWAMHDELFRRQQDWATERAEAVMQEIARTTGLKPAPFNACFNGRHALERVLADIYDAQRTTDRTPSFVMLTGDGTGAMSGPMPVDAFVAFLEKLVAGATPREAMRPDPAPR